MFFTILIIVICMIVVSANIILFIKNKKYYEKQLQLKRNIVQTSEQLVKGVRNSKYIWFELSPKERFEIVDTNFKGSQNLYETVLNKDADKINVKCATGGGFNYFKFKYKDDVNANDTLSYCTMNNKSNILVVLERKI